MYIVDTYTKPKSEWKFHTVHHAILHIRYCIHVDCGYKNISIKNIVGEREREKDRERRKNTLDITCCAVNIDVMTRIYLESQTDPTQHVFTSIICFPWRRKDVKGKERERERRIERERKRQTTYNIQIHICKLHTYSPHV